MCNRKGYKTPFRRPGHILLPKPLHRLATNVRIGSDIHPPLQSQCKRLEISNVFHTESMSYSINDRLYRHM